PPHCSSASASTCASLLEFRSVHLRLAPCQQVTSYHFIVAESELCAMLLHPRELIRRVHLDADHLLKQRGAEQRFWNRAEDFAVVSLDIDVDKVIRPWIQP